MEDFDVIYAYTNDQAIDDGIKVKLGSNLYATTNAVERVGESGINEVLEAYNAGIYAQPASADQYGEADQYFALYETQGERVWAILDGEGLHIILPEDY